MKGESLLCQVQRCDNMTANANYVQLFSFVTKIDGSSPCQLVTQCFVALLSAASHVMSKEVRIARVLCAGVWGTANYVRETTDVFLRLDLPERCRNLISIFP